MFESYPHSFCSLQLLGQRAAPGFCALFSALVLSFQQVVRDLINKPFLPIGPTGVKWVDSASIAQDSWILGCPWWILYPSTGLLGVIWGEGFRWAAAPRQAEAPGEARGSHAVPGPGVGGGEPLS